jgi:hypothetical protein
MKLWRSYHLCTGLLVPGFTNHPIKFRFIIASSTCTTKQHSQRLTIALKLIEKQHERYCAKLKTYTGINRLWIIHNSKDIHNHIQGINEKKRARNISTFDFSTLYTKINHAELKEAMKYILLKAFTGSRMDNISIYSSSARWTNNPRSDTISVDEELLQEMLNYLIDNVYFTVGKQVFRQTIGIPIGMHCAPFLANLFLYYYEFKYMDRT